MSNSRDHNGNVRILIPINATPSSFWGLRYALWRRDNGETLDVLLLYVTEPLMRRWDILRFRPQQEVDQFRNQHAEALFDDAAQFLQRGQIPYRTYVREGELAQSIVDTAEEQRCHGIVLSCPTPRWLRVFPFGVVHQVTRRRSAVPVIAVDQNGRPVN